MKHVPAICSLAALAALTTGCAHQDRPQAARAPAPVAAAEPLPPSGAARGLTLPSPDSDGHFATINSHISDQEAAWHLRAALNVAALSCRNAGITSNYHQLLKSRKAMFTASYASETSRFRSAGSAALDQHMTRLYNFFAQPPAQLAFCQAAETEAEQAVSVSPAQFPAYAAKALDRLEAPVLAFYLAYDRYRHDLAAWKAGPRKPAVMTASIASPSPVRSAKANLAVDNWRIQIGAFSGQSAAEAAWKRARTQVPGLADYKPSFEPVPGHPPLVRLQLAITDDGDDAQRLCASAAAGGFHCMPLTR
jgi:hypothetical protein